MNDFNNLISLASNWNMGLILKKEIPLEYTGLHWRLSYQFVLTLGYNHFNYKLFKKDKCYVFFIDYCEKGFYIDWEEL